MTPALDAVRDILWEREKEILRLIFLAFWTLLVVIQPESKILIWVYARTSRD